jgi:glycine cleavage system H lipoate-binding protein
MRKFEQQWENFFNIGMDDIGVHYLQHINGVSSPERALHFQDHSPLFSLAHNEGTVTLEAPCSGNIISFNTFLCEQPILFQSVENNQWILCVYVDDPESLTKTTMTSSEAKNYFSLQMELLHNEFSIMLAQRNEHIGTTLHDGGKLPHHLREIIGSKKYYDTIASLFIL